jgi:hypothetical protein
MRESAQVVSFPHDVATKPLLRDFTGDDRHRLDELAVRLSSLSDLVFCLKNSEPIEVASEVAPALRGSLCAIEHLLDSCLAIAELRPVEPVQQ